MGPMKKTVFSLCLLVFCFYASVITADSHVPVITSQMNIDAYIGQVISIKGEVANTKIPTIFGIDVKSDSPNLRGKVGIATGILEKWIITGEELERRMEEKGMFPHRGPGVYYRLKEVDTGHTAQVRR